MVFILFYLFHYFIDLLIYVRSIVKRLRSSYDALGLYKFTSTD